MNELNALHWSVSLTLSCIFQRRFLIVTWPFSVTSAPWSHVISVTRPKETHTPLLTCLLHVWVPETNSKWSITQQQELNEPGWPEWTLCIRPSTMRTDPVTLQDSAAQNSNFKLTKLFPILLESTNIYPNSSQIFSSLSSDNDKLGLSWYQIFINKKIVAKHIHDTKIIVISVEMYHIRYIPIIRLCLLCLFWQIIFP